MAKNTAYYKVIILFLPMMILGACSTNPATGEKQFTAFMPASSEAKIGAEEHDKILAQYGGEIKDTKLKSYVQSVGQKLVPFTERKDVQYKFTVLDSPILNAFALPGGYVYISRGILMYANDEAELASVIGHEIGHVTGQHAAQRYSKSVLASIAGIGLSAALKSSAANQAFGLGANLYLTSYSRGQESEADSLGIRYINRADYDVNGSPRFLKTMDRYKAFSAKEMGQNGGEEAPSYLSTHPVTADRVRDASAQVIPLQNGGETDKVKYMQMINGMIYGDSPDQGFVDDNYFVHPALGFKFSIPSGYYTENTPSTFIAVSRQKNGAVLMLENASKSASETLETFAKRELAKNDFSNVQISNVRNVNGFQVITVTKRGKVNNMPADLIMNAIQWDNDSVFVINTAIPDGTSVTERNAMLNSVNSFSRLTANDRARFKPKTIQIRAASASDTVATFARALPFNDGLNEERFRVLNGMDPMDKVQSGRLYKTIVQ